MKILKMHFIMNTFGGKEKFDQGLARVIYETEYNLIGEYNEETGELKKYKIKNPGGENSDVYIATKNGSYTFTIEINGKEYTKTVDVNNIEGETNLQFFVTNGTTRQTILKEKETENPTTFENAYIIDNGKVIEVTNQIEIGYEYDVDYNEIRGTNLYKQGITEGFKDIILKKDNIYYCGKVEVVEPS